MVELVQQHHPDLGVAEIVKMLNIAQEEYSQRTRMLEKATQFDLATDQRYDIMAGTYVDNWSNKYATNQWVWWTERDAVGIAKFNPTSERFTSPAAAQNGKKITLFYYKKATSFTEPNSGSFSWT